MHEKTTKYSWLCGFSYNKQIIETNFSFLCEHTMQMGYLSGTYSHIEQVTGIDS